MASKVVIHTTGEEQGKQRTRAGAVVAPWSTVHVSTSARRFIAVANALSIVALVWSGWLLGISAFSLALLVLSIWSIGKPSARLTDVLFKFASVHMLGSMVLVTLGALV